MKVTLLKGLGTLALLNMSLAEALKVEAQSQAKAESKSESKTSSEAEFFMGQFPAQP